MTFMQAVLEKNYPIWDECISSPFVQELKAGTLPFEKFKEYMIQDSIYIKHYARIYGAAIFYSQNLRDIQLFYSVLSFVTDSESVVRLNYLQQFGMTDDDIEYIAPLPENKKYINFMLKTTENHDVCEILMAVLPCMLSYSYIFRKIAAEPETKASRYYDFIQDYAADEYFVSCKSWTDFTDRKCESLSSAEQKKLSYIFEQASYLELDFWKMAYGEQK